MTIITLADGRKLNTITKKIEEEEEELPEADNVSGSSLVPKPVHSMRLEDLPSSIKVMNATCAIIGYKLLGLPNRDICDALGCRPDQLDDILNGEVYKSTYDKVIQAFLNGQKENAKDILANGVITAATKLVEVVKTSKNEANRIKAAESILNRTGISDGGGSMGMNGLTIKIIKDTKSDDITISM